ncbi:MAG TPA: ChbG/HpnK family deacetylase, partial [Allocoleopsis sp.]
MEPQFIFNADDFGPVDFINEGVYYAVNLGVVNSVQVIVNGDTEQSLKGKLKKLESYVPAGRTVDVGVHFTLTSGAPLHGDTEADKLRLWKNMVHA